MIINSAIVFLRIFDSVCDLYEWGQKIIRKLSRKPLYSEGILKNHQPAYTITQLSN
jgi:hypothetical protein